ncbi:MAG: hypothetical protein K0Q55_3255, partial [Verrucomicrobia bacterium]|nr:hypothetical protein [Verrucomicrobiota bacterium]
MARMNRVSLPEASCYLETRMDGLELKPALAELAASGVYVGTSSWKYAGWIGQLYDEQRYVYRGKFAESRFERNCLAEY